jgi:creatinine amidohydrolase
MKGMTGGQANDPRLSVCYAELTPSEFRRQLATAPIAYLPLGTLEWHGEHLPLGTDGLISQGFFMELARRAGGIVLPMLFVGPDLSQHVGVASFYGMDIYGFPGQEPHRLEGSAYWIDDELFARLLESILARLARAGFRIVVGHGHGPSGLLLQRNLEAWSRQFKLKLFTCWREEEKDDLGIQIDHAAANETSLMMALHPHLVHPENLPESLEVWPTAIGGKDPRVYASAEAGRRALDAQLQRMHGLLQSALRELNGEEQR